MNGGSKTAKGTVTSLSSIFSPEEAQGAARRVEEAIAERRNELDRILSFVEDNSSLVKLVQRLPDQLHHEIMVPFGKGAFFPGKLIHTNEFLVLLGEGYYADRTAKQTVDILNRRGKELESQAESLKAMIKDLKAEASFFDDTANEAAEGLVEIMEDYVDEVQTEEALFRASTHADVGLFENENVERSAKDEEFARMMAVMDELEAEEMAAEGENSNDGRIVSGNKVEKAERDEFSTGHSSDTDDDETQGNEPDNNEFRNSKFNRSQSRNPVSRDLIVSERFQCDKTGTELFQHGDQNPLDKLVKGSATKPAPKGEILLRKDLTHGSGSNIIQEKVSRDPKVNENLRGQSSGETTPAQSRQPAFDSQKAFTGSIVERPYNLEPKNQAGTSTQSASSLPSKPVSRFKMQRK